MGCGNSKESGLQTVDDSVHVMLAHDRKRQKAKGETPHGYVPRAEHPLLKPKQQQQQGTAAIQATEENDADAPANTTATTPGSSI